MSRVHMGSAFDYFRLARPYQWYKNVVIFIALFFTSNLFSPEPLLFTIIGFVSLCLVSSSNYVINDIMDAKADRHHPEKKKRPIAAGKIGVVPASVFAIVMLGGAISLAWMLSGLFLLSIVALFILTQIYSFGMKNEPFADLMFIGTNFVIRALSGVFIIDADISPWLIICAFFLAIFLAVSKRKADLVRLGEGAVRHKKVMRYYPENLLDSLIDISVTSLIIAFSLYSFMKQDNMLLFTLPFIGYILFRYMYLVNSGSRIGRHPHLAYTDIRMVIAGMIVGGLVFVVFYIGYL